MFRLSRIWTCVSSENLLFYYYYICIEKTYDCPESSLNVTWPLRCPACSPGRFGPFCAQTCACPPKFICDRFAGECVCESEGDDCKQGTETHRPFRSYYPESRCSLPLCLHVYFNPLYLKCSESAEGENLFFLPVSWKVAVKTKWPRLDPLCVISTAQNE